MAVSAVAVSAVAVCAMCVHGCERHVHACFKPLAISALVCTTTFHAATILHAHMQLRQWPSPSIHKTSRQLASQSFVRVSNPPFSSNPLKYDAACSVCTDSGSGVERVKIGLADGRTFMLDYPFGTLHVCAPHTCVCVQRLQSRWRRRWAWACKWSGSPSGPARTAQTMPPSWPAGRTCSLSPSCAWPTPFLAGPPTGTLRARVRAGVNRIGQAGHRLCTEGLTGWAQTSKLLPSGPASDGLRS